MSKKHVVKAVVIPVALTAAAIAAGKIGYDLLEENPPLPPTMPVATAPAPATTPATVGVPVGDMPQNGAPSYGTATTAPAPATKQSPAGTTTTMPPGIERRLPVEEEWEFAEEIYRTMRYGGRVGGILAEVQQISEENGGTGKTYSARFTETPRTPIEQELRREWDAVVHLLDSNGRIDPQNPPHWFTADEWMNMLKGRPDIGDGAGSRKGGFKMAVVAKEITVLRDFDNQRKNGFPNGVYVAPDEANALEILFNMHRIALPTGVGVKSFAESKMTPEQYKKHEEEFVKKHGAKQRFRYSANGKTTEVEGWRALNEGRIYLSPETSIRDIEAKKLNEQYGPTGDVNVAGKEYTGWMDRDTNSAIIVGEDGTIATVKGIRLPPAAKPALELEEKPAAAPSKPAKAPVTGRAPSDSIKIKDGDLWTQINTAATTADEYAKKYMTKTYLHTIQLKDGNTIGADEITEKDGTLSIVNHHLIIMPDGTLGIGRVKRQIPSEGVVIDPEGVDKVERPVIRKKSIEEIRREITVLEAQAELEQARTRLKQAQAQYRTVGREWQIEQAREAAERRTQRIEAWRDFQSWRRMYGW